MKFIIFYFNIRIRVKIIFFIILTLKKESKFWPNEKNNSIFSSFPNNMARLMWTGIRPNAKAPAMKPSKAQLEKTNILNIFIFCKNNFLPALTRRANIVPIWNNGPLWLKKAYKTTS